MALARRKTKVECAGRSLSGGGREGAGGRIMSSTTSLNIAKRRRFSFASLAARAMLSRIAIKWSPSTVFALDATKPIP